VRCPVGPRGEADDGDGTRAREESRELGIRGSLVGTGR
jgi:hypothetical protein